MTNYALADWADQTALLISEIDGVSAKFPEMFQKAIGRIYSTEFSEEVRAAALTRALWVLEGQVEILKAKATEIVTSPLGKNVFIGHGRDPAWRELDKFLDKDLHLEVVEFNSEPTAGKTIVERLKQMLDSVGFAFLIMTAEDHVGQKKDAIRARQNVIHEIGLFQGRLGFAKAIILLEVGCVQFSNVDGLIYIPFPKGNIRAAFHDVRATLEAAGLVRSVAP